jgi:hypothetical protein
LSKPFVSKLYYFYYFIFKNIFTKVYETFHNCFTKLFTNVCLQIFVSIFITFFSFRTTSAASRSTWVGPHRFWKDPKRESTMVEDRPCWGELRTPVNLTRPRGHEGGTEKLTRRPAGVLRPLRNCVWRKSGEESCGKKRKKNRGPCWRRPFFFTFSNLANHNVWLVGIGWRYSSSFLEHLQEFAKFYLTNLVFCQLLKRYAK